MRIEEMYTWDREAEVRQVYGTSDARHPLITKMVGWTPYYVSGPMHVLGLPQHYDFPSLRHHPAQLRTWRASLRFPNVVAFQTRNPLHRAHKEFTQRAARLVDGTLVLHPVVGVTRPGDVDHFTRVRSYQALLNRRYDSQRTLLSLLPLSMRFAGPREAMWHAIIRRNYGVNYFIVGRDHASPGMDSRGRPFYDPYAAQSALEEHAAELGVQPLSFAEFVYLPEEQRYEEVTRVPAGQPTQTLSGTAAREEYLDRGHLLPEWFTRPEVAAVLGEAYPPRHRQGYCIWLTGLSGAGKSTIAELVAARLLEHGRPVTVLDGDVVRTNLSQGLGFSRADRDTNVRRIGFVAAEIVRHRGWVICAAISPYGTAREAIRQMVGDRNFIEVFVDTPLAVCEERDTKGLYALARAGNLTQFTGIDDPYESPTNPELHLHTASVTPDHSAGQVIAYLQRHGFLQVAAEF